MIEGKVDTVEIDMSFFANKQPKHSSWKVNIYNSEYT